MADQFAMLDARAPRTPTDEEERIVAESIQEFNQLQTWRNTTATMWEEIAELIDPPSRNTFMYGNFNWPGQKKTDRQIDATGMLALNRFGAILDSLLTPRNMIWHGLRADNPYVMKQRGVRLYFEQVQKALFKYRYKPIANFSANNQGVYKSLGAYGTAGMFIDSFDGTLSGQRGIRYRNVPIGELFLRENHQKVIDGFCRWFKFSPEQAYQKWPDTFPAVMVAPLKAKSPMTYDFLHRVVPRTDYDPQRLDYRGMPYCSYYISLTGRVLLSQGGYRSFPMAASRYEQTPGEINGRGPASYVLPALKTLNAEKTTFLKQGHRAADPVLFTADDGVVDASMRPGALNKGGVSPDGKLLVQPLPTGNIQITETMMGEEKALINDSFLVTLFQVLTETPTMTATEVIERTNEKGILLAPTVGRQQDEYLGPLVEREIAVLAEQGLLPPMPQVLREARGEYEVVYTSPLSRAMRAQEASGFIRTLEIGKELVNITQDPSHLDTFDIDTALPEIAEIQGVPASWMSSDDQIAAKRQARAKAQQVQQQIQAAPAQAAMMKAQAAQAKAGMGGQSGPAPGQMPAQGGAPLAEQVQGA
jgi:hypothetical protein